MNVTMEFIARQTGVSKATVSRVINNKANGVGKETRARVQHAIEDYGYNPNLLARGIATSHTKIIGLIVPDITNPFFPALIKVLEDRLGEAGYTVLLCESGVSAEKEDRSLSTLIANRVDGIVIASTLFNPEQAEKKLMQYQIPVVILDRKMPGFNYNAGFFVDNEYGAYIATKYLIQHKNKRIAVIQGPTNLSTARERLEGYKSALCQYQIAFDSDLVVPGDFSCQSGFDAVMQLQAKIDFTAIFACNDVMAFGALQALRKINRKVPEDVEVIGYDDINCSEWVTPTLTTMRQPVQEMANGAARAMMALVENTNCVQPEMRLEASLIVRGTTRPDFK